MQTFKEHSAEIIARVMSLARLDEVKPETAYEEGQSELLPYACQIVESLVLPGSGLDGFENLSKLLEIAQEGHSCLLMVEHYSNLDLPELYYFLGQHGRRGVEAQKAIIAIAGMKLSIDNPAVAAFAAIYSRIVICPSRSIARLDPEKDASVIQKISALNRAAARVLGEMKKNGKIILVYPSGTRYRPWAPDSKRGVREIDTYVKGFDYMCFVAKKGLIMRVQQESEDDMMTDLMTPDVVRYKVGEPVSCADFREIVHSKCPPEADKKQALADAIMKKLEELHESIKI